MEIEVPQRIDVIDLEAPDLQPFEPVAGQERALRGAFRARLAEHAPGDKVAPKGGIRRNGDVAARHGNTEVVDVQLHRPARVLAILDPEDVDDTRGDAGEAADIVAQAVSQRSDRIGDRLRRVIPAFQRRNAETNFLAGQRMAPGLGGQRFERGLQLALGRRCGQ